MSHLPVSRELLEQIRRSAREKSLKDKSMSHHKWLDHFCSPFGYSYTALKRHVEELEAEALAQAMTDENRIWDERLASSLIWGTQPGAREITLPVPDQGANLISWPRCLTGSRLFSLREAGPRTTLCGPVFHMEGLEIVFEGEELTLMTDQTLLMAFIMAARGQRCGALVACGVYKPQAAGGRCLPDLADSIAPAEIARTLWRLTNCRLTIDDYGFDGPILAYADARWAPEHITFAFNPAFANFYYPILRFFNREAF